MHHVWSHGLAGLEPAGSSRLLAGYGGDLSAGYRAGIGVSWGAWSPGLIYGRGGGGGRLITRCGALDEPASLVEVSGRAGLASVVNFEPEGPIAAAFFVRRLG